MAEIKIEIPNIQTNHTYGEYQRYFSHLLKKGKLKRFSLKEKDKLDPNRQYWKLTDDKGETYYYELPKYIKPDSTKTAYSMKRVMHRRPARIAIAIFAGAALISFTSMIIGKNLQSNTPDPPPQPLPDPEGLFKAMKDFQDWKKENPDADATSKYSVAELATIGMANTLYDDAKYEEATATYPRRPLLTVGYGGTTTSVIVMDINVDVTNAFIFKNGRALEESISYCNFYFPGIEIPQVGCRDFYSDSVEESSYAVESNRGKATGKSKATWKDEIDKQFKTKEDYEKEAGKSPDSPFLYSIDATTVKDGSVATKKDDGSGYDIDIKLDEYLGTGRYVKRMYYLSKKTPKFNYVNLHFSTDNNLHFLSSDVNEKYLIDNTLTTFGNLKTTFYYNDVPDIPDRTTPFDYSKYPA